MFVDLYLCISSVIGSFVSFKASDEFASFGHYRKSFFLPTKENLSGGRPREQCITRMLYPCIEHGRLVCRPYNYELIGVSLIRMSVLIVPKCCGSLNNMIFYALCVK